MFERRVTILAGHFGGGKTEIALNGALELAARGLGVSLVDLDIVKPYFRSRSARIFMAERGVDVIAPEGENAYADLPIVLPQIRTLLQHSEGPVVLDVGGDPTGARVLGSLEDVIPHDETDHLLVLNFRRPFIQGVDDAVTMVREIEAAARLPVTGIVSNTHLMDETTPDIVTDGFRRAERTATELRVPVVAVAVDEATARMLDGRAFPCPVLTLMRLIRPPFQRKIAVRKSGPPFSLT